MRDNWKDRYLVPAIYTVPWAIGLLNSVFCFTSSDTEAIRKIIAAFSVYTGFFLNTLVDIFLLYVKATKVHVKPFFASIFLVISFLLLMSIVSAWAYYLTENIGLILGVIIFILVSYYFMAMLRRNPDLCFTGIPVKKRVVKSHLR